MPMYQTIAETERKGISCTICTIVAASGITPRHVGSKMIVYENGDTFGSIGGGSMEFDVKKAAIQALDDLKPGKLTFCIDKNDLDKKNTIDVFFEPIAAELTIVIFGAGHIGKETAFFAKKLGWKVIICDDREELCNNNTIPDADEFIIGIEDKNQIIHKSGIYVFCTRNSEIDASILPMIIDTDPKFIGVLGSIKRWDSTKKTLIAQGFDENRLSYVKAPIGVDIGAETPVEIALSIVAQILQVTKGK